MPDAVYTTWLGAAGIFIETGQTAVLIDGFFSRPSLARVAFTRLSPDPARIDLALARVGITHLDAFLAGHTHYDHVLDAAFISRRTSAILFGSPAIVCLARAAGLPEDAVHVVHPGDRTFIGSLSIEWLASQHNRPDLAPGKFPASFRLPAHASGFRGGTTFAQRILTPSGALAVLGSAGFQPEMFLRRPVDSLFLSVAGLSRQSPAQRNHFFNQTILASQARNVFPIHWDNFFAPIASSPTDLPKWIDNVRQTINRLAEFCAVHGVIFSLPPFFKPFNPFSDVK